MDKASLIEAVNGHIDNKAITPRVLQQWWDKVSQNLSTGGDNSVTNLGDVPVGAQLPFGGTDVPYGWLLCDGSAVSRTDYADLFAVIGTAYGAGDGSTTFNLPDKRGRVSVGLKEGDTSFDSIGKDGGEKKHKLTMDEIPNFKFSTAHVGYSDSIWSATNGTHTSGTGRGWTNQQDEAQRANTNTGFYHDFSFGGGGSHNNLQPYEVDNWVIKALPVVSRITIGNNDNWFVDGIDTGHTSRGKTGDTGKTGPKGDQGEQGPQGKSGVYIGENEPADPEISVWVETDGDAEEYALKGDIPTKVSELENDSGFIDDLSDYYKKDEVYKKSEVYRKEEVYNVKETLSKAAIERITGDLSDEIERLENLSSDVLDSLEGKADKDSIPDLTGYAKEQWVLDKGYITKYVEDLVNYYSKDSVYSKEEVNAIANSIKNVSIEIVNYLPSSGKQNVIYFLSKTGTTGDVFDEYIFVNNSWERIGSTEIDLSSYATTEWVNSRGFITNLVDNLVNYYAKSEVYSKDEVYNKSEVYKKSEVYNKDETFSKSEVYSKSNVYNKSEVNKLTDGLSERLGNLEEIGGELLEQLEDKADKSEIPSLSGYATEQWVKDKDYMPVPDFREYMAYSYYDKTQTDAKFDEYYNKEEIDTKLEDLPSEVDSGVYVGPEEPTEPEKVIWIDTDGDSAEYAYKDDVYTKEEIDAKLEDLPTGGTELTGGDNIVIEDNAINVYTNTGYKVSDKDIKLQPILDNGTTGATKMVYIEGKEITILYDGTIKIRRSENGIDFETITLPYSCVHLVYNADAKRLYGTNSRSYFIYSDDYGLTWKTISNSRASGITTMAIGYGQGFRSLNRSTKEVVGWVFNENAGALSQNARITSVIVPEFTAMVNNTQFVWCNSTGTFKYGAGSSEGDFASLSSISVNLLKRVNDITFLGLKNDNKMYLLEPANSITQYKWIAHTLPDTCTLNDIVFNPYDETYYLFTTINTYYKTKDFITFENVDKNNLRGRQGYFTSMGIQMTTSSHNKLLLAPTRTKLENKLQEHDRDLNKSLWVGKGLELTEEGKVNVKINSSALGVSEYGLYLGQIDEYNLPENLIEGIYVAKAEEKGLFDPYEVENWFYSEDAYPEDNGYNAVKFIFTQDGSFYDQITWETEFVVEKYEYGYLFYDASFTVFNYVKLGNLSWLLDSIIK